MSPPKKPDKNANEYLKGKIRQLQSENRQLRKRNSELERKRHMSEIKYVPEPKEELKDYYDCPECGKGEVKTVIEFQNKEIESCNLCDYRNIIKK